MILHDDELPRHYSCKVLDVRNKLYRHHLQERPDRAHIPVFRLCQSEKETKEFYDGSLRIEPITSWRVVAECGDEIDYEKLPWMTLPAHRNKFSEAVTFMLEYMKSDNAARSKVGFLPCRHPPPLEKYSCLCLCSFVLLLNT